jgi:hypothetical protein
VPSNINSYYLNDSGFALLQVLHFDINRHSTSARNIHFRHGMPCRYTLPRNIQQYEKYLAKVDKIFSIYSGLLSRIIYGKYLLFEKDDSSIFRTTLTQVFRKQPI